MKATKRMRRRKRLLRKRERTGRKMAKEDRLKLLRSRKREVSNGRETCWVGREIEK